MYVDFVLNVCTTSTQTLVSVYMYVDNALNYVP